MKKTIKVTQLAITIASTVFPVASILASEITIIDPYYILDHRSDNAIGVSAGLRQQFGAVDVRLEL